MLNPIATNLMTLQQNIRALAVNYSRNPGSVTLLAVSKGQPVEKLIQAIEAGQRCFGENYVQEAQLKMAQLKEYAGLEWHYLGALQSNKLKLIAAAFDWVHTVANLRAAERLNRYRPAKGAPLQVCIQVNISQEISKQGLPPDELIPFAQALRALPRLQVRGLMVIPEHNTDIRKQRQVFAKMKALFETLLEAGITVDTLSMGMSEDYEAAIAEGATMVRLGRAIFGQRF